MCSRIYKPGQVQGSGVSEDGDVPRVHGSFTPEITWNPGWNKETENWHKYDVKPEKKYN